MIRRPPRSTLDRSSAASDVYKRQVSEAESVYRDSKGAQFKDLDIKSGTLSYSKSQKLVIFQNDQDFYSINIVSTDDNYKKIEGVALKIPEEYLSK